MKKKCSEKRLKKRSCVCQVWDEAYEGTWARVLLAFLYAGSSRRLSQVEHLWQSNTASIHWSANYAQYFIIRARTSRMVPGDPSISSIDIVEMVEKGVNLRGPAPKARAKSQDCLVLRLAQEQSNVFTAITCACCYGDLWIWSD
jgi:hypothetical protein